VGLGLRFFSRARDRVIPVAPRRNGPKHLVLEIVEQCSRSDLVLEIAPRSELVLEIAPRSDLVLEIA
jgi:hypothetical protein